VGPLSNRDMRDLLARIEARPSVQAAGAIYLRPLELGPIGQETGVRLEGQTDAASRRNPALNFQVATPGYFHATRMRLRGGRFFSDGDDAANAAVAVVGESTARRLWPGEDPIGRRLLLQEQTDWRTVVGIVGDVPYRGLGDQRLDVYEPAAQSSSTPNYVAIRTPVDAVTVATMIRTELRGIAPTAVVDSVATLDAIVARAVSPWRFASWLLAIIGLTAFLLTTVGLICIVWLEGLNRRQELAIRLALGAQRRDLLRPVLVPAAWQCATGLVIGTLVGLASARALHGLLFRVGPLDPATWLTVAAIVISVVTLATYLPARRAATVDPLTLLRQ
jgi:putative ABC transport system permease protein